MLPPGQQFNTEVMLLSTDEPIRKHRDALKVPADAMPAAIPATAAIPSAAPPPAAPRLPHPPAAHPASLPLPLQERLSSAKLSLDEIEGAIRHLLLRGQFHLPQQQQGVPESVLTPFLHEQILMPPSPFRTIAELAACLPWLLRVHQQMQWVQQMPNGLMTVQRLICPAASDVGGLAAPDGVLAIDWRTVEEVPIAAAAAAHATPHTRPRTRPTFDPAPDPASHHLR